MGLLDEAIREHLELKRVRGADPGEVIRQEREALGASAEPHEDDIASQAHGAEHELPAEGPVAGLTEDEGADLVAEPIDAMPAYPARRDSQAAQEADAGELQLRPRGVADEDRAPAPIEQETAEVDMHAMLELDEHEETRLEPADREEDVGISGPEQPWGEPPEAARG